MQQAVPPGTPPVLHGYTHCRNTILCRYCSAISLPSLCDCLFVRIFPSFLPFFSLYVILLFFFLPFFIFLIPFFFLSFSSHSLSLACPLLSLLSPIVSLLLCPSFFMAFLRIQHQNIVLRSPTSVQSVTEVRKKFSTSKGTPIEPFTGARGYRLQMLYCRISIDSKFCY